jgi:hypothetical protein
MFSLKSLLFIVAVAALGAAGLVYRNQVWASTLVGLTLGILLFAVLSAWLSANRRLFWGPFALIGVVYLAIVSLPPLVELHYNLPTTQLVVYGMVKLQSPTPLGQQLHYSAGITTSGTTYYVTPGMPSGFSSWYYETEIPTSNEAAEVSDAAEGRTISATTDTSSYRPVQQVAYEAAIEPQPNVAQGAPGEQSSPPSPDMPPAPSPPSTAPPIPAPASAPAPQWFSYPGSTLFQMATTQIIGDGFPAEARAFLWVAQSLWTLLLAFASGMACSWFFRKAALAQVKDFLRSAKDLSAV